MHTLVRLLQALQGAARSRQRDGYADAAPDFRLGLALTQLLIDSGHPDAAGCLVIATLRTHTQIDFEVICAERFRSALCTLLTRSLSRPFPAFQYTWLLSQHEALALIDLSAHPSAIMPGPRA